MTTLLVVRHGRTEWNAADRVQGQSDPPLDAEGQGQTLTLAARLYDVPVDGLVSSDLRRAADTAAALGRPVETDPRLRERHFGEWQGLRLTEIAERWPVEFARWRAGDPSPGCGIEHMEELSKRVAAALRDVADRFAGGTAVVVTHGGAAREGCAALLGWPAEVIRTLGGLGNCRWSELRFDAVRGWQLRGHNLGGTVG